MGPAQGKLAQSWRELLVSIANQREGQLAGVRLIDGFIYLMNMSHGELADSSCTATAGKVKILVPAKNF